MVLDWQFVAADSVFQELYLCMYVLVTMQQSHLRLCGCLICEGWAAPQTSGVNDNMLLL